MTFKTAVFRKACEQSENVIFELFWALKQQRKTIQPECDKEQLNNAYSKQFWKTRLYTVSTWVYCTGMFPVGCKNSENPLVKKTDHHIILCN